jgi:cellulose synthase/poly-beta-1,6-N-acetylglucosamine synthase-like glycosyltransferase
VSQQPYVSVVVPVFNGAHTIEACIEALLAQDYDAERYEVIVVDNMSTDDTETLVGSYPVTLLHEHARQSSYAARNTGIEAARGEIVAFTDADCVPAADWLGKLVAAFSEPTVVGAGGAVIAAEPAGDLARLVAELDPLRNGARMAEDSYVSLVGANAAYRRDALQAVGCFDDRMTTGGDIDLSWRVQRERLGEVLYVPDSTVLHQHRDTVSGVFREFRRYGYCSGTFAWHMRDQPDYPECAAWQGRTMLRQALAMTTYAASLVKKNTVGLFRGVSSYERKRPFYLMVAEGGALSGRAAAAWETRWFRRPPQGFEA